MSAIKMLPCPFCGSTDTDPEGWSSAGVGPVCNNCNASADSVERWNTRPLAHEPRIARAQASLTWAVKVFGAGALERQERCVRFIEEALELAHADDVPLPVVLKLLARIWEKAPGDYRREAAQALMTLDAYCVNRMLDPEVMTQREFDLVTSAPIEERQASHDAKVALGLAVARHG